MVNSQKIIEGLTDWINLRLSKPLTIDKIALRSGYTKWHLQRMFRRVKGTTLIAYIRNQRLEKAYAELLQTADSLSTVAQRNGFNSPESFSRAFTQRFILTPTEFRRIHNSAD
ncbi:helix-turn-helix domain-containing protein [Pantoea sp. USHLN256]|uniref:helix-turn-helix domain-containing protein n=1 Tax=Pantoea sp. USHLN256 TaxID=3081293 RepID=UPI003019E74F